ncbi:MAG: queuine tRNA-ribosyltransferase family protein [Clostridia bacterium]|nr:queuine tRNA-ribosyltransferase family protein [Clostridia bacterium]
MADLITRHGPVPLPNFFPDATYGAIRATGFEDMEGSGLTGLVMNSYHLMNRPGPKAIKAMGGLNAFTGFSGPILTDSGGFQLYSLIRENPAYGEIRPGGIIFRPDMGREKLDFTPEKCIQAQFQYGSDIMMALDVCTAPDDPYEVQKRSVDLTVAWGRRCREAFDTLTAGMRGQRPLLFGIVQGGADRDLRIECGKRLEEIGFDGYGFGGWPLDADGRYREDVLRYACEAMPDHKPKYAMGLGRPEEIVRLVKMGYSLFDCVIPTREARHQRLYVFKEGEEIWREDGKFYAFHYALDERHARDSRPVDETCACPLCSGHSRAYLYHLFKIGDAQALRLASAHNLFFYGRLMERLREGA